MTESSLDTTKELMLTQPTVARGEILFSAFKPGWGFCSFAVPAGLAMQRLGAKDGSASQLHLAFQLNRQRIAAAVALSGNQDPRKRVMLSQI